MLGFTDLLSADVYDLEQERFRGMPNHPNNTPGFTYALHRRHEGVWQETRTPASGLLVMSEHTGTHIDALCHQAENMVMFGGVEVDSTVQTSEGFTIGGAESIPPLVCRGVLLDIAADEGVERLEPDRVLTAADLQRVAGAQGSTIGAGDVVLVRTGFGALWNEPDEYVRAPGINAEGSEWLAGLGVTAVGADNTCWDTPGLVDPTYEMALPGHLLLIVRAGIYILEHLNLETLAKAGVHEFAFIGVPLKIRGATGAPLRPIALAEPPKKSG